MDFSDPIPREYYQPAEPVETQQAKIEEFKQAEQAMPFIDGVIEWFDEVIKNTDSLSAALEEANRRKVSVEVTAQAYDIVREILTNKKGEFESLKMTFDK